LSTISIVAMLSVSEASAIGRDGRIYIFQDSDGTIWVGGRTETVISGTVKL